LLLNTFILVMSIQSAGTANTGYDHNMLYIFCHFSQWNQYRPYWSVITYQWLPHLHMEPMLVSLHQPGSH